MATINFNKTYSFADYFSWSDGKRYELIDGKVKRMTPAPNKKHAVLTANIFGWIWGLFKNKKAKCRIFHAPFDVRFPDSEEESSDDKIFTVVQPDICVVCDEKKLDEKGCKGAPDLIVEVISPSTAKNDFNDKFNLYQKHGVREYWIVQPNERVLTVYKLKGNNAFDDGTYFTIDDIAQSFIFDDIKVNMREIFED